MSNIKRGRGRPRGSGLPDGPRLDQIADLMIADPGLRPTTAIKRTNPAPGQSEIRRLQDKWRTEGASRLRAARERLEAARAAQLERSRQRRGGSAGGYGSTGALAMDRRLRATQRLLDAASGGGPLSAVDRAARGIHPASELLAAATESPLARQMRAIENSSLMKAARALEDSPLARAARAIEDSPSMRLMRQIEDSPTMRLMREIENSPALKLSRELDRLKRYGL